MEEVWTKDAKKAARYAVPLFPSKRNLGIIKDKSMSSHFDFLVCIQVFAITMYKRNVVPVSFAIRGRFSAFTNILQTKNIEMPKFIAQVRGKPCVSRFI